MINIACGPKLSDQMYGEVRTSLKAVQLVIEEEEIPCIASKCKEVADNGDTTNKRWPPQHAAFHITVTADRITVSNSSGEQKVVLIFPSCLQLQPNSCSSIDWVHEDGLHARIRVCEEGLALPRTDNLCEWSIPEGHLASLECRACGRELTSKILKKMVPLPSDNWEGIMEELWCCSSKDLAGAPPDPKLTPATSECFLGTFEVVLSSTQLIAKAAVVEEIESKPAVTSKSSKLVKQVECSRCHSPLGTQRKQGQSEVFHLWKFKTVLSTADGKHHTRGGFSGFEPLIAGYLKTQLKNDAYFKFMVESEDHKAQILLWLISPESLLLWSEPSPHEQDPLTTYMDVQCRPIIKVLYKTCWDEGGRKLRDEWNHDMMVQSFVLSHDACIKLADILSESTGSTPPSMRKLNDFAVGFLKSS